MSGRAQTGMQVIGRLRNIQTPMAVFRIRRNPERYITMYRNTVLCELEINRPGSDLQYLHTFKPGDWQIEDIWSRLNG